MVWDGRDPKNHLIPNPLPWARRRCPLLCFEPIKHNLEVNHYLSDEFLH